MISILIITCLSLVCIILQYKLYTLTKIREHQDETIKLLEDNSTSPAVMVEFLNINEVYYAVINNMIYGVKVTSVYSRNNKIRAEGRLLPNKKYGERTVSGEPSEFMSLEAAKLKIIEYTESLS